MRFLCDRCKTRYSIGDERVRGKILKIRCKNCANVITVREGMPDIDGATPRRTKTTQAAPVVQQETAAAQQPGNALNSAFASAMTSKPPPALEEEWYVSIDGEQEGPFSLAQAQAWVGSKAFDAELHCWSEGFDDWLPVDKVSHFRGLRRRPSPPTRPPPVPPRAGPRPVTAAAPRAMQAAAMTRPAVEEEPKPLFAATMASLEKSVAPAGNVGMGPAIGNAALRVDTRSNGNGLAARAQVSVPSVIPAAQPVPTARGLGLKPATASKPFTFDSSDGATVAEAQPFSDVPPADEPVDTVRDAKKPVRSLSSLAGLERAASEPSGPALPVPTDFAAPSVTDPDDDDLDIGEVSRVVNLADLMKAKPKPAPTNRTGAVAKLNGTGAVPRISGQMATNTTASVPLIDAVEAVPGLGGLAAIPEVPAIAPAVAASHRRGMIALLVGAVLLLGVAGVFVFTKVLNREDDDTSLGGQFTYNGQRPDNPIRPVGDPGGSDDVPTNPFLPPRPPVIHRPQPPVIRKQPDLPTNSLGTDDIEAMARSTSNTTTACFRRADRGADAIRLADVKRIKVTFRVAPDGSVSNVDLSEKSSQSLTQCLTRMIASWKFKPNAGGNFGFVFAKPGA